MTKQSIEKLKWGDVPESETQSTQSNLKRKRGLDYYHKNKDLINQYQQQQRMEKKLGITSELMKPGCRKKVEPKLKDKDTMIE